MFRGWKNGSSKNRVEPNLNIDISLSILFFVSYEKIVSSLLFYIEFAKSFPNMISSFWIFKQTTKKHIYKFQIIFWVTLSIDSSPKAWGKKNVTND